MKVRNINIYPLRPQLNFVPEWELISKSYLIMFRRILIFTLPLLICGTACSSQTLSSNSQELPSTKVTMNEFPGLDFPVTGPIFQLPLIWNSYDGDNMEYAKEDFNDNSWDKIEVGKQRLIRPGKGKWRWYRIAFNLPTNFEGKDLLLDLGSVSVYDEVYLNGELIGKYGDLPPNNPPGASDAWRKYPIPAKAIHTGRNQLAIRVYLGHKGGLHQGNYTLQVLDVDAVIGKFNLKAGGVNSLKKLLTTSLHLNTFTPDDKLLINPVLTQFYSDTPLGKFTVKVINGHNTTIGEETTTISLEPMNWKSTLFQFKMPEKEGDYRAELMLSIDGKTKWKKTLPFNVIKLNSMQFKPKVDESLTLFDNRELPVNISSAAMGHFSPRDVDDKKLELFDDLEKEDARSGLSYSAHIMKEYNPLLFLANTRPVPKEAGKAPELHRCFGGYQYDGLDNAWLYGYVGPNHKSDIVDLSVKKNSWAKRTYHYTYQNSNWMDFSLSAISPAWMVTSNAQTMLVFEGIEKHGIGLPTYMAYENNGKVEVVDAKEGVQGKDMSANWVLAWFNGGEGWDEFDTPYLFILENRPDLVQCNVGSALLFSYPETAGSIQGMPLYGLTLQHPERTATWGDGLPIDVAKRCDYWSNVLVNAPDEVHRNIQVDYVKNKLTVKDEFTHLDIQDDWNTKGIKIAPISPTLSLTAASEMVDISFSRPAKDLEMTTFHGPLLATESTENIVFSISNTMHYIRQARNVTQPDNIQADDAAMQLNEIVKHGYENALKSHPWKETTLREKIQPGLQYRNYVNLLLTLPYLKADLRGKVEEAIKIETEKYFLFSGIPGPELANKIKTSIIDVPAITVLKNPCTDLKLGVASLTNRFGIDEPYWTSNNLYMVWLYAHSMNRFEWLEQNYSTLELYFNNIRNSHGWDISASWDSFGGFRVGNGLQEESGIYAGMVAMARIANKFNDQVTSDQAAYYATMEMIAMRAAVSATDYLNQRRPWLATNTKANDIEYAQKLRPMYYAEFNEFAGLSQAVILPRSLLNSTSSFILSPFPEPMRLYQEIWPKFTDDFYSIKYDAILGRQTWLDTMTSMDVYVYMLTGYPKTAQEVFDIRKKLDLKWWDKLPDYRGYLDSKGKIEYIDLW